MEGSAFDELHAVERVSVRVGAKAVDGNDVGVGECGEDFGFLFKAGVSVMAREGGDLHGDGSLQGVVGSFVDDAHAAARDFFFDAVLVIGGEGLLFGGAFW